MHHFEGEHAKIFLARGTAPDPTAVSAFGTSISSAKALDLPGPPDHILDMGLLQTCKHCLYNGVFMP